ncbi:MAG: NAD-dependent epimerase/dehydratase family protein [Thomasclavelia ramosa]
MKNRKVQLQDNFINDDELKPTKENKKTFSLKRVLIGLGANSYIGESVEKWLNNSNNEYEMDTLDMLNPNWKEQDFSKYDIVFHVAGIAHQKETEENKHLYYEVNRDLAIEVAKKAKDAKIKHFIFMSSMSVYGLEHGNELINKETKTQPTTNYGKAKLQAEQGIMELADNSFVVSILRPPMVYGG